MDANKAARLRQIGYQITACGTCAHSDIDPPSEWGTCRLFTYQHEKHTGPERPLSINRHGTCPAFKPRDSARGVLHGFEEFLT